MLCLYNTLTRKIEEFTPVSSTFVGFYSCGPTVYDYAHLGHARTYIFNDILQRILTFDGYTVKRVMNITDVGHLTSDSDTGEDKMEKGAKRENKTVWNIAEFYTKDFFAMMTSLNIIKPEIICKATDYIPQMITMISTLEKKGFTYTLEDGVYFDTSKIPDYGKLTGLSFDELQKSLKAGARVEIVVGKKYPTDFALWKLTPKGVMRQMEWDSPWGKGFPGWHIECSAMAKEFLGNHFDLHTGGVDHIPVHHTNEIAQSESANAEPFVNYWLHGEHLLVDGQKMSKSLGNFYRLSDIQSKGFDPLSLRYLFMTASYRYQMNFTWESLLSAQNAYFRMREQVSRLKAEGLHARTVLSSEKMDEIDGFRKKFNEAINNDMNMSAALGVSWEVLKSNIPSFDKYDLLVLFDEVLGLELGTFKSQSKEVELPKEIQVLLEKRQVLRKEKKYAEADSIRKEIEDKGYNVEDKKVNK